MQLLVGTWVSAAMVLTDDLVQLGLEMSNSETVGDRPDQTSSNRTKSQQTKAKIARFLEKAKKHCQGELVAAA
jgi:molybdopterin-biosynthesis enzyme MoeA-like protein